MNLFKSMNRLIDEFKDVKVIPYRILRKENFSAFKDFVSSLITMVTSEKWNRVSSSNKNDISTRKKEVLDDDLDRITEKYVNEFEKYFAVQHRMYNDDVTEEIAKNPSKKEEIEKKIINEKEFENLCKSIEELKNYLERRISNNNQNNQYSGTASNFHFTNQTSINNHSDYGSTACSNYPIENQFIFLISIELEEYISESLKRLENFYKNISSSNLSGLGCCRFPMSESKKRDFISELKKLASSEIKIEDHVINWENNFEFQIKLSSIFKIGRDLKRTKGHIKVENNYLSEVLRGYVYAHFM